MINCYYLLYKLNNCSILWIVDVMDIPDYFYNIVKNIKSDHETYYLVYKLVNNIENEIKLKKFSIFKNKKMIKLIAKSK